MSEKTEYVWHGKRFWVQEPKGTQHAGWNTDFEPCVIFIKTAKRIGIVSPSLGILYLNREVFERDGRVYHSKPHEYFYAVKPSVDPEKPKSGWRGMYSHEKALAFSALGLSMDSSREDVKRAYKNLANKKHPDKGGSHTDFINLKNAYDAALRFF